MSDTGKHEPDEHPHIRKILKDLPKVEAAPDFELRLQRSLQKEKPSPASPRRFGLPALAYPVLALFVVTIVSYIVFFRIAGTPVIRESTLTPERNAPSSGSPSTHPPGVEGSPAARKKAAPEVASPVPSGGAVKESPPQNAAPGPVQSGRSLDQASPANEGQTPAATRDDKIAAPAVAAPQNEVREQMNESAPIHPAQTPLRSVLPSSAPMLKSAVAPLPNAFESSVTMITDSAARVDSLARDSLRSQEQRRVNERLQKKKRPIE